MPWLRWRVALGVGVFRGDSDDVLGRYVSAAEAFGFDRSSAPPATTRRRHPGARAAARRAAHAARPTTRCEDGLPYGAAVEAMTATALVRAAREAIDADDREHVTTFVRRNTHELPRADCARARRRSGAPMSA